MATKKTTKAVKEEKVAQNSVILGARITEKAAKLAEKNGYTFNVAKNTTKNEIKKAIKALYKVSPVSVRTVTIAKKPSMQRGARGKMTLVGGGKKAYVYLKKGDKIEVL